MTRRCRFCKTALLEPDGANRLRCPSCGRAMWLAQWSADFDARDGGARLEVLAARLRSGACLRKDFVREVQALATAYLQASCLLYEAVAQSRSGRLPGPLSGLQRLTEAEERWVAHLTAFHAWARNEETSVAARDEWLHAFEDALSAMADLQEVYEAPPPEDDDSGRLAPRRPSGGPSSAEHHAWPPADDAT